MELTLLELRDYLNMSLIQNVNFSKKPKGKKLSKRKIKQIK